MSTPYQPIYDSALLFCGHTDRRCMPPLSGLLVPSMRRRGSTSQPKCLCVEESKKERKAVSEEARSRSAHKFGECLHVSMHVYLSFLFVSSPVFRLVQGTFLFVCTQSKKSVAEWR